MAKAAAWPWGSRTPRRRPACRTRAGRSPRRRPVPAAPSRNSLPVALECLAAALAAHRPPQGLGLAGGEAGQRHRHLEHLLLEHHHAQRVAQQSARAGVVVGGLELRGRRAGPAVLDVGVHRAADDRPGADERHLDGQVVQVLGQRLQQGLHLRPALDLEHADRVGLPGSRRRPRGRRSRSATGRSARPRVSAIRSTHSSTAESIPRPSRSILRKPASAQESLSHWQIWRPSMAAGTTGTSSTSGRAR